MKKMVVATMLVALTMIWSAGPAGATAKFGTVTIDGDASDWGFASTEFDTGARPCSPGSNPWDLSGVKATFAYDDTNLYALFEGYPDCGLPDNANGALGAIQMELYLPCCEVAYRLSECPDHNPSCSAGTGKTVVWSGDQMSIELSIPLSEIQSPEQAFDPTTDPLAYWITVSDADASGGFDSHEQTAGFVTSPVYLTLGFYEVDFEVAPPLLGPPTSISQCMRGGWRTFTSPRVFQGQKDCARFVRTRK
jgi:hypothetical protein